MNKLNFTVNSAKEFINFLEKFSPIENMILLEFEDGFLKTKAYTGDKSVVKSSKIELERIFKEFDNTPILIGLYNTKGFYDAFKHFGENDFMMELTYEVLNGKNIATEITLSNKKLKINFDCASYKMFLVDQQSNTHLTDETVAKIASVNEDDISFELTQADQAKIISLNSLDDAKIIEIGCEGSKIYAKGKSFNLTLITLTENKNSNNGSVRFYKDHFRFVDKENSVVTLSNNKIIFHSDETDTVFIIGGTNE